MYKYLLDLGKVTCRSLVLFEEDFILVEKIISNTTLYINKILAMNVMYCVDVCPT